MVNDESTLSPALRSEIEATGARIREGFPFWLSPFLRSWVAAITLGRTVYLTREVREWPAERFELTMRHELAHVRQVVALGLVRFLARYVSEYIRNRRTGLDAHAAYFEISFEREARAAEKSDPEVVSGLAEVSPSRQPDDI